MIQLRTDALIIAKHLGIERVEFSDRLEWTDRSDGTLGLCAVRHHRNSGRIVVYTEALETLFGERARDKLVEILRQAAKTTLYVNRPLQNADELIAWAKTNGFTETMPPEELHVTIAFSKTPVDWSKFTPADSVLTITPSRTSVMPLGPDGAVVVKFESDALQARWKQFVDGGASWDHPSYQPHVTITYDGAGVDLTKVKPYAGQLVFGPEAFAEVDTEWDVKGGFDEGKHPRDEHGRWTDGSEDADSNGGHLTPTSVIVSGDWRLVPDHASPSPFEVLINPSEREIKDIALAGRPVGQPNYVGSVRATLDKHNNLFIWESGASTHEHVEDELKFSADDDHRDVWYLVGSKLRSDNVIQSSIADHDGTEATADDIRKAQERVKEWIEKSRHIGKGFAQKEWDESEHPRDEDGKFTFGGGAEFVSPNVASDLQLNDAVDAISGPQQGALKEASSFIDKELNLDSKQADAIGAWSDGAENSVADFHPTSHWTDWDRIALAASMKGHLADQKSVLAFQQEQNRKPRGSAFAVDVEGNKFGVQINPTTNDLRSMAKGLSTRILIDADGNLYAWDANRAIHAMVAQQLNLNEKHEDIWVLYKGQLISERYWNDSEEPDPAKRLVQAAAEVRDKMASLEGNAVLLSFEAKGSLETIHQNLLSDGLAFHTLVPHDGGATVYAAATNPEDTRATIRATEKAAQRYDSQITYRHGRGEFIGDLSGSGSDREQRDRARDIYEGNIRQSSVHGSEGLWERVRYRWGKAGEQAAQIAASYSREFDEGKHPRDEHGRWTDGGDGGDTPDQSTGPLPEKVQQAFTDLADQQRGAPEAAMLKVQYAMGGGVLNPVVEHGGDLTHRMSEMAKYDDAGYDSFKPKVEQLIRAFDHPYGFKREMDENIRDNAKERGVPEEQVRQAVDAALEKYADAHSKLPVYNKTQWEARTVAVCIGQQDFQTARFMLGKLQDKLADKATWKAAAFEHKLNENGYPMEWTPHGWEQPRVLRVWDESEHPRDEAGRFTDAGDEVGVADEATATAILQDEGADVGKQRTESEYQFIRDRAKEFAAAGVALSSTILQNEAHLGQFLNDWDKHIKETPAEFRANFLKNTPVGFRIDRGYGGIWAFEGLVLGPQDRRLGNFSFEVDWSDKTLKGGYLSIDKSETGKGLGKRLLGSMFGMCMRYGLDKVAISANIDVGGYAWAKYGFIPTVTSWSRVSRDIQYMLDRDQRSNETSTAESWDELSRRDQDNIRDRWYESTETEFFDSEVSSWRDSGQPLEEAKQELARQFMEEKPTWAMNAITDVMGDSDPPIPYTADQLHDAIVVEYHSRYEDGRADPEVYFDDAFLREPTDVPVGQIPLPGMETDLSTHLTDKMRSDLETAMIGAFNAEADDNARDMDSPDHLWESARESQGDFWDSMDDSEKFDWARRENLLPESEVQPNDLKDLSDSAKFKENERETLRKLAESDDPKAIWGVADSASGKDLLLNSSWEGVLNLKDKEQMGRFMAYIAQQQQQAAQAAELQHAA